MESQPYISIIIPTLNSDETIEECLNSIISQTFSNFEIILLDAVSDDNTINIVRDFRDKRIKIHSEPDKGIYDAMNKGIKLAIGEWLYFLGSDDRLYNNNVLNNVFKYMINGKYQVIYGNVLRDNKIYDGEFDWLKFYTLNICHQAIFYKRDVFNKIGEFNLKYRVIADYDLNIRWFLNNKIKKKYIEEIIAEYSEDGFSSYNSEDNSFWQDRDTNFLHYGFFTISKRFWFKLLRRFIRLKVSKYKSTCIL